MSFLRRKKEEQAPPPPPTPVLEEITGQQYVLKLAFLGRSSDGLRMSSDPAVLQLLPQIVEPLSMTPI
jgi:tRNA A37 threonylcarbamoyladenosine synthetase subunit TsaC/SUA5/YrdC